MSTITSIKDLRRLLQQDRQSKVGRNHLGRKARAVLTYMLNSPGVAAVASITEIAEATEVDPSTLTRLGQRLGFAGFSELQNVFRGHVKETQPFYSTRIYEHVYQAGKDDPERFLESHANTECQKLTAVSRQVSQTEINRGGEWIAQAKTVYVVGMRATYGLSFYFGSYLSTLRSHVRIIGTPGYSLTYDLADIGPEDVVVAVSFSPYTRGVLLSAEIAARQGARIVAITNPGSPLVVESDRHSSLIIDQPYYFDSSTTHFFIMQALLIASARCIGTAALKVAKRREGIDKTLDIELV